MPSHRHCNLQEDNTTIANQKQEIQNEKAENNQRKPNYFCQVG